MFINALALSSFETASLGISLTFCVFVFLVRNKKRGLYNGDMYILLFLFVYVFSYLFFATGEKCTNHLIMWSYPIIVYYFFLRRIICAKFSKQDIEKNILGVVAISTIVASSFAIIEFISKNFVSIPIVDNIYRGGIEEYSGFALDRIRARSFMEESGQFAFYWELFAPLTIYWFFKYVKSKILQVLVVVGLLLSLFVTYSAAGFMCVGIASLFLLYDFVRARAVIGSSKLIAILIFLSIVFICVLLLIPEVFDAVTEVIRNKTHAGNSSYDIRTSRFKAMEKLDGIHLLLGYGPAAFSTLRTETFISLYLGTLMNTGVIGLFFLVLFLVSKYVSIRKFKNYALKVTLTASLVMAVAHFALIDLIYVPWFWFFLIIVDLMQEKNNERSFNYYR